MKLRITFLLSVLVCCCLTSFHSDHLLPIVSAARTRTRTPVRTLSRNTDTRSLNETRSKSRSKGIVHPPGRIHLVSALAVPALCMMATSGAAAGVTTGVASASSGRACRNVVFNVSGDAFQFQSRLLTLAVRQFVVKPVPCRRPCPYGFPTLLPKFADFIEVFSNVTHLTVQLPIMPSLAPDGEHELMFDWRTRPVTFRGTIAPIVNPTTSIFVTPVSNIQSTSGFLSTLQGLAGVSTFVAALLPSNPSVYDSQIAALIAASECMHPGVRKTAAPGLRLLRPTVAGDLDPNNAVKGMWHNLVLMLVFASLHFFGASVARMRAVTWIRAMHRIFFPALSFQLGCVLSCGMINGAIFVLRRYVPGGVSVGLHIVAVLIIVLALAMAILPIVFRQRIFPASSRTHDLAAYEFPSLLRRLLAHTSWGPTDAAGMWFLPFSPCRPGSCHWALLSFSHMLGHALIFSLVPRSPAGCGWLAGAGMLWCTIYGMLLIKFRPYRSSADTALSAVSAFAVIFPLGFIIARATQLEATDAGENGVSVLALNHFIAVMRAVLALIAIVVEARFIRPVVWADSIAALSEADSILMAGGKSSSEESKRRQRELEEKEKRGVDAALVTGEPPSGGAGRADDVAGGLRDQELLQELLLKQAQARHELQQRSEMGRKMTDEERQQFLFFGVPEAVGMSLQEHEKEKSNKKSSDMSVETNYSQHMGRLIRGEGPMPPMLQKKMEIAYKFL